MCSWRRAGPLGLVTLNRPKALNALSLEMIRAIRPQLEAWSRDSEVKAVAIRGAGGKAFCSGGDVRAVALAWAKPLPEGEEPLAAPTSARSTPSTSGSTTTRSPISRSWMASAWAGGSGSPSTARTASSPSGSRSPCRRRPSASSRMWAGAGSSRASQARWAPIWPSRALEPPPRMRCGWATEPTTWSTPGWTPCVQALSSADWSSGAPRDVATRVLASFATDAGAIAAAGAPGGHRSLLRGGPGGGHPRRARGRGHRVGGDHPSHPGAHVSHEPQGDAAPASEVPLPAL